MNKFNDILVALRNNSGVAINGHNLGGTVKLEAIALLGKEVVGMPEDSSHYSINSLVLREDGQVVLTSYSNAVMYPEYLRDTPQESADEFNKPENHTPGMSYRKLTDVTLIKEEQIMNTTNIVAASLGLTFTADNPTPGAAEMGSMLYSAADNKMFLSITQLESAEVGAAVLEALVGGMSVVNKCGMFAMEMQTEADKPLASVAAHPAYMAMLASVPNAVAMTTMIMKTPFVGKGVSGDAMSILAITEEGTLYGLTIMTGVEEVSAELARSFLDGSFVMEHIIANAEILVANVMEDPTIDDDITTFHSSEALQKVGAAVLARHADSLDELAVNMGALVH